MRKSVTRFPNSEEQACMSLPASSKSLVQPLVTSRGRGADQLMGHQEGQFDDNIFKESEKDSPPGSIVDKAHGQASVRVRVQHISEPLSSLLSLNPSIKSVNESTLFAPNEKYIGEDINREIQLEAKRAQKDRGEILHADSETDKQDWPFDPNLTCPKCKVVFRRGQIREYRYHVDECEV